MENYYFTCNNDLKVSNVFNISDNESDKKRKASNKKLTKDIRSFSYRMPGRHFTWPHKMALLKL